MFPHTITIFTYNEQTGSYDRQVVEGVWWNGSDTVSISSEREHSASTRVVIPRHLMHNVSVKSGSYVVKGRYRQIESVTDLDGAICFTVSTIKVNEAGWDIDNMTISGN